MNTSMSLKKKNIRNSARTITATAEKTVPNSMEIHIAYTCNVEREFKKKIMSAELK